MSLKRDNVYLVGPMGSGKTTIGQRLAQKLGLEFFDSDHEIEKRTGVSVNLIFDIEGENGFRKRENRMLQELTAMEGVLIATGGGVVLDAENRRLLSASGIIVYLQSPVAQQLERLRLDRSRPLLPTDNREQKLVELAEIRDPLYEQLADLVFPAQNRNIDAAVSKIQQSILDYRADKTPGTSSRAAQRADD